MGTAKRSQTFSGVDQKALKRRTFLSGVIGELSDLLLDVEHKSEKDIINLPSALVAYELSAEVTVAF